MLALLRTPMVVREGHAGLLYRDGLFLRRLDPGRYRLRARETVTHVSMTVQTLIVSGQEVLSADAFLPRLSAVTTFTVTDPHLAATAHEAGYRDSLTIEVQLALRALAAGRTAEALARAGRDELDGELSAALRPPAAALGLSVQLARLRDIILPADLRRLLTGVEKARREGQAALERSHAEQAALRSLANAARSLRNNPELHNLRLLQALSEAKSITVVLGASGGLYALQKSGPDLTGDPA